MWGDKKNLPSLIALAIGLHNRLYYHTNRDLDKQALLFLQIYF